MPRLNGAVEALDLVLAYGERQALAAASFSMPAGLVTAIIGPNGSGKSTLLNAIAGLAEPSSGTLRVLGTSPVRARRWVAYVPQSTKVNDSMPVTVWEVVAMGRYGALGWLGRLGRFDRQEVGTALDRLGVARLAGRHLGELSAGERQRVFVAQGLVQERRMLLLDEPLTGLDLVSAEQILEVVAEERRRGRTVVMTTHDLGEAGLADHVLLLASRLVAAGPPGEVLTAEHLTEAYEARLVRVADGLMVDDAAHAPVGARHVHLERAARAEQPPSG